MPRIEDGKMMERPFDDARAEHNQRWHLKTEARRRFDSETGAEVTPIQTVWLMAGADTAAIVCTPRDSFASGKTEQDRDAATEKRGRWIAAQLNAASPYVEATDQPLDEDALTEALDAIGPGHKTLRDVLELIEAKYEAVVERYREIQKEGA